MRTILVRWGSMNNKKKKRELKNTHTVKRSVIGRNHHFKPRRSTLIGYNAGPWRAIAEVGIIVFSLRFKRKEKKLV